MTKGVKGEKPTVAAPSPVTVSPGPDAGGGYETFDGDEALRYSQVGGRLVSITARYPSKDANVPTLRSGKRYRFVESKVQLDQLIAQAEEGS